MVPKLRVLFVSASQVSVMEIDLEGWEHSSRSAVEYDKIKMLIKNNLGYMTQDIVEILWISHEHWNVVKNTWIYESLNKS